MTARYYILLTVSFLLMLGLRIAHITADPPFQSFHYAYTDEVYKTIQPRDKILTGKQWGNISPNHIIKHPVFILTVYSTFLLFGVGLVQARLISVVFGLLSLIIFYKTTKNYFDSRTSLITSILLGVDFSYIMYNRLALQETMVIFFMLLTIFWALKGKDKGLFYFLSGISAAVALLVKLNSIFLIAVCMVAIFLLHKKGRGQDTTPGSILPLAYFISGVLIMFYVGFIITLIGFGREGIYRLASIFKFYLFQSFVESDNIFLSVGKNALALPKGILHFFLDYITVFFISLPIPSALIFVYTLNRSREKFQRLNSLELFSIVWIILGLIFFQINYFSRNLNLWYLSLVTPPIYMLCGTTLMELRNSRFKLWPANLKPRSNFILSALLNQFIIYFILMLLVYKFASNFPTNFNYPKEKIIISTLWLDILRGFSTKPLWKLDYFSVLTILNYYSFFVSGLISWCLATPLVTLIRKRRTRHFLPSHTTKNVATLFLFLHLLYNSYLYIGWLKSPKYLILNKYQREVAALKQQKLP